MKWRILEGIKRFLSVLKKTPPNNANHQHPKNSINTFHYENFGVSVRLLPITYNFDTIKPNQYLLQYFNKEGDLLKTERCTKVPKIPSIAIVKAPGGKLQKVNIKVPENKVVTSCSWRYYIIHQNGFYGLRNHQNRRMLKCLYHYIMVDLVQNRVIARTHNRIVISNLQGKKIASIKGHYIGAQQGDHIKIMRYQKKGKKMLSWWGIVSLKNGQLVLPFSFGAVAFTPNRHCFAVLKGQPSKALVIQPQSEAFYHHYSNGLHKNVRLISVLKQSAWGIISKRGVTLVPLAYDDVEVCCHGLFKVNLGGEHVMLSHANQKTPIAETIGGKWGVVNANSWHIVPIEYDAVSIDYLGYIFAQNQPNYDHYAGFDSNLPYDVYDFQGSLIVENKPSYEAFASREKADVKFGTETY